MANRNLPGPYYRFQYGDSSFLYILKDAVIDKDYSYGIMASYSTDGGKSWVSRGFFPFDNCNQFYKIKRLPSKSASH